ncbi:SRPBCC family protein [Myxococcaceae bacterium GXIMD 01537]
MTWTRNAALAVLLAAGMAGAEDAPAEKPWKTIETEPITIKVQERADGKGKNVWAEGTLKADARDAQAALLDQESYRRWMPYVKESRVVSTAPDGSRVTYTMLDLPIVSSRDYTCNVVNDSLVAADGTGAFTQRWWAVPDALPQRRGVVRLPRNEGSWRIEAQGEGTSHAVYKFSVDPGGSLPGFLANTGQRGGVLDTWKAVEKRAAQARAEREKASGAPTAREGTEAR